VAKETSVGLVVSPHFFYVRRTPGLSCGRRSRPPCGDRQLQPLVLRHADSWSVAPPSWLCTCSWHRI